MKQINNYTSAEKWCPKCQTWKTHDNFHSNKSTKSGLSSYCRNCFGEWTKPRAAARRKNCKDSRYMDRWRLHKYGLTAERYKKMYEEQKGICAMPKCVRPIVCVDHDHMTGIVRALLCQACNAALGIFGDDPERIRDAAEYIEKFRSGNGQQYNPITSNS